MKNGEARIRTDAGNEPGTEAWAEALTETRTRNLAGAANGSGSESWRVCRGGS
jgi:hypothetical protein